MPQPSTTTPAPESALVEAARYALLRRLAPSLRHEAVSALQPMTMISGVLERRLRAPLSDLTALHDGVTRLNTLSRAAMSSCLDLIGWLSPEPDRYAPLPDVVRETLTLLRGPLGFRGFTLRDELTGVSDPVPSAGLRHVLPACLLWLTDRVGGPAEITLSAQGQGAQLQLDLALKPSAGPSFDEEPPPYRPLRHEEVSALADAAQIRVDACGDSLSLRFLRAP